VEQQHRYSIRKACKTLGISRSEFYAYRERTPSDRQLENEVLSHKIREVFEQHSGRYGAKRIAHSLQDEGIKVNRKRIVKLMRAMDSVCKGCQKSIQALQYASLESSLSSCTAARFYRRLSEQGVAGRHYLCSYARRVSVSCRFLRPLYTQDCWVVDIVYDD